MDSIKRKKWPEFTSENGFAACSDTLCSNDRQNEEIFKIPCQEEETGIGRSFGKKLLLFSLVLLIALAFSWTGYFFWKTYHVSRKIIIENQEGGNRTILGDLKSLVAPIVSDNYQTLSGEKEGRINILLLGLGGENHPGKNLTDTIMIMSFDTQNKKVALLSLPRDLYVNIPDTNYSTRINSVYQFGLSSGSDEEPVKETIESITGLPIHYFFILDFDGFKKVVDDVGGINVSVERDIYDPRYPGPNYSYETFEIKKGLHKMDGDTALKYVRERHADPEGDFGRAKRQQQVIQAVKNKIFTLGTFLNPITLNNLLNALEKNLKTDVRLDEINSFIALSKQLDTQNVTNTVADAWHKDSLLKVSHVYAGGSRAFILIPRVGNFSEVKDLAENIFDLDVIRKRQSEIEKEEARILLVNRSADESLAYKIKSLFQDKLKIKNVEIMSDSRKGETDETIIYDQASGQKLFTLDEIIKKLPARLSDNQNYPNSDIINKEKADLVVVLGKDLVKTYSFEEDSLEDLNNAEDSQADIEINNFQ
jgi:LCP family protein required for cell wall assembly